MVLVEAAVVDGDEADSRVVVEVAHFVVVLVVEVDFVEAHEVAAAFVVVHVAEEAVVHVVVGKNKKSDLNSHER